MNATATTAAPAESFAQLLEENLSKMAMEPGALQNAAKRALGCVPDRGNNCFGLIEDVQNRG